MLYYDSVAPDEVRMLEIADGTEEKIKKIFKVSLEKVKIGDILRIRCVLSATRCLINCQVRFTKKIEKIFKSELAKIKIGGILRNCCS